MSLNVDCGIFTDKFKDLNGLYLQDLEIWEVSYFEGENEHDQSLKFLFIEEGDAQENAMFYPQKRPLTNWIYLENERHACVIHYIGTIE